MATELEQAVPLNQLPCEATAERTASSGDRQIARTDDQRDVGKGVYRKDLVALSVYISRFSPRTPSEFLHFYHGGNTVPSLHGTGPDKTPHFTER